MKRFLQCVMVAALFSMICAAQAPAPTASAPSVSEGYQNTIYGGYQYTPTDWGGAWSNFNGIAIDYARDMTSHFAAVADFDWIRNNQSEAGDLDLGNAHDASAFGIRFGPRYNLLRKEHRIQPYVVGLFGVAHMTALFPYPTHASPLVHHTWSGFSYAAGGGVDLRFTRHFGVRGEWLHVGEPWGDESDNSQWDRVTFGGTWRF